MSRSSLVYNTSKNKLTDLSKKDVIAKLREKLRGKVEQAFLFGSFAQGTHHAESDIDLILVLKTDKPFIERPLLFKDLVEIYPDINPLVYTPDEFATIMKSDDGFWKGVRQAMELIL